MTEASSSWPAIAVLLDEAAKLAASRCTRGGPVLVVTAPMADALVADLLHSDRFTGVVLRRCEDVPANTPADRIGWLHHPPYDWTLPRRSANWILFLGPRRRITAAMLKSALLAGVRSIVFATAIGLRAESVWSMLGRRLGERLCHMAVRRVPALERGFGGALERDLTALLDKAAARRQGGPEFVRDRIILANRSLSMGGAERQIVNTLVALEERGFHDLRLVCERRWDYSDNDPYGPLLAEHGIPVEELAGLPIGARAEGFGEFAAALQAELDCVPTPLADDVLFHAELMLCRRPGVVHAWQDATAVKAGLAACLVGVPKVILGLRNRSPLPFAHWLPWLRPALRVLARRPGVVLINNSAAGARDYERWLDLPPESLTVVYNGLSAGALAPATREASAAFRTRFNIACDAPVVGSMFRFYPEKDPTLWLRVAAFIAERKPAVRFLLVGDGPLLQEMRQTAAALGIFERVSFAGEQADPRAALAAMDVFLLVSRHEGLPNVILEAQAQGVPAIARSVGGLPEAIDHGSTGLVIDNADPAALAAAVLQVLEDRSWAEAARRYAPAFVAQRFGAERMIDETLRLYGLDKCGVKLCGPSGTGRR